MYRAVDKFGDTIDFMLSEHREAAATAFFKQAININSNGLPEKVVMDKSGANYARLENINFLMLAGLISFVEILQVKYLNNLIEQDHRFIKKITNPMMGFEAFYSAEATISGIKTAHVIRKGLLSKDNIPAYQQLLALAG